MTSFVVLIGFVFVVIAFDDDDDVDDDVDVDVNDGDTGVIGSTLVSATGIDRRLGAAGAASVVLFNRASISRCTVDSFGCSDFLWLLPPPPPPPPPLILALLLLGRR